MTIVNISVDSYTSDTDSINKQDLFYVFNCSVCYINKKKKELRLSEPVLFF